MDERKIPLQYDKSVLEIESALQENMNMELYTINSIWNFLTHSLGMNVTRENFYSQVCILVPSQHNKTNILHVKVPFKIVENVFAKLVENEAIKQLENKRESAEIDKLIPLSLSMKQFYLQDKKYTVEWKKQYKLKYPFFKFSNSGFEFSQDNLKMLLTLVKEDRVAGDPFFALLNKEYRPVVVDMLQNLKTYRDTLDGLVTTRVSLKTNKMQNEAENLKHSRVPLRFSLKMLIDYPTLAFVELALWDFYKTGMVENVYEIDIENYFALDRGDGNTPVHYDFMQKRIKIAYFGNKDQQ
eukprot:3941995-Rhodomonas_salina.1